MPQRMPGELVDDEEHLGDDPVNGLLADLRIDRKFKIIVPRR
jgi:hypothetical protein